MSFDLIPQELRALTRWVNWRHEIVNGRQTKVPYMPDGRHAKSNDASTWSDFETCLRAASQFSGVGIVMGSGLTGVDLDRCVKNGELSDFATRVVEKMRTYTEFSPSGEGLHLLCSGALPPGGRVKTTERGKVEMYSDGRFLTVTGCHVDGTSSTVEHRDNELAELHSEIFSDESNRASKLDPTQGTNSISLDDAQLLEKATHAKNGDAFRRLWDGNTSGYPSHSEADAALCGHLSFWTGGNESQIDRLFRRSGLMRDKWDERHSASGETYGQLTVDRALSSAREFYSGNGHEPKLETVSDKRSKSTREEKRTPTHDEIRDRWLAKYPDTAFGLGDWRRYENGIWNKVDTDAIKAEISLEVEAAKLEGIRPASHVLSSVMELARVKVFVSDAKWDANPDILVCRNGALYVSTRFLQPHDPSHYATSGLSFDYDPSAPAPIWNYVLDSTIPNAKDFLQEFAGYCLTTATRFEIAVWFYGPRGSGKSTVIGGIVSMLGKRAGILGLADIERSAFALTNLPGKTLISATEQPNLFLKAAHILNTLISGEPLTIERKYHDAYVITPHAKVCWAMNELPRVGDASSGLFRRVKVVKFPELPQDKRDPEVKELVKVEAAGILNWALDGLVRLNARGRFDIPECVKTATDDFERQNDVPALFVADACVTGNDYKTQSQNLYTAFKLWCETNGHKPMSATRLAEEWSRLGFTRYMAGGKVFWRGVGLVEM